MNWFTVDRRGDKARCSWHGEIGEAAEFLAAVGDAKTIFLKIDSTGGSTSAALQIAETLKGREVEVFVPRLAASAALVGLVIARRVVSGRGARFLIHNPVDSVLGNAKRLRYCADNLETVTAKLVALYRKRINREADEIREWLSDGRDRWFSDQEAKAMGLVDEVVKNDPAPEKVTPMGVNAPAPENDGSEALLYDCIRALGKIEVRSKAEFARNLNSLLAQQVREIPAAAQEIKPKTRNKK